MRVSLLAIAVLALATFFAATAAQAQMMPRSTAGVSVVAGGGVGGFIDEDVRDSTDAAGLYDLRLTYGTKSRVALEAAYIGSAQSVDAFGLDSDAMLYGNGAEALGRVHVLTGTFQPYVAAGLGWRHFDVDTEINTSSVRNDDDVFEIPVAAGLTWAAAGFVLDGRATVRPVFDEELLGNEALHNWGVTVHAGLEF